jgi:ribosome-associated toxin RatA of RatAB toxin-antitoxin module
VLLPYAVEGMFDLIEGAEHYPEFLPWCTSAVILERSDEWVAARLEFSYLKVRFGLQTRNRKGRPLWLQLRMVEGPFSRFQGEWKLVPLGGLGCKVSLALLFDIADGRLDALAAPALGLVARAMVDAFVQRARATLRVCTDVPPPAGKAKVEPRAS